MTWKVYLSKKAEKFLNNSKISSNDVSALLVKAIKLFSGGTINLDIKKLKGKWHGFHRIRKGGLRIIANFNFEDKIVHVEIIDWRDHIY